MFIKTLLIVCVAFYASQEIDGRSHHKSGRLFWHWGSGSSSNNNSGGGTNNNISNNISNVNVNFNDLIDLNITTFSLPNPQAVSTNPIINSIEKVVAPLQKIVQQLIDLTAVVPECVSQELSTMPSLPAAVSDSIQKCVDNVLGQVQTVLNTAQETIDSLRKLGDEIQKEVEACGNILCKIQVTANGSVQILSSSNLVARVGLEASKVVSSLNGQIVSCASNIAGSGQEATALVGHILECIK